MSIDDLKDAVEKAAKDATDIRETATAALAKLKDEISALIKQQVSTAIADATRTARAVTPGLSLSLAAPAASPALGATHPPTASSPVASSSAVSSPAPSSAGKNQSENE
ncbi:hypothetical protein DL771_005190 [Monosporascus sp. 5C6A]|nr:hypothetical protein DL771_005190 [Monosporascus sp. 5C6A]